MIKLSALQKADSCYLENVNLILELSKQAVTLFKKQNATQKRRLTSMLVSNCSYKDGNFDVPLKKPFAMIMESAKSGKWCSCLDYFRNFSLESLELFGIKSLVMG